MSQFFQAELRGVAAFYKPKGMTSHDAVDCVRRITGERTVGHAGTLDPLARGVLVIGIGREATKQLGAIEKTEKEYLAEIRLGVTSTTDDEEGEKTIQHGAFAPTYDTVTRALEEFQGTITQAPPIYSALKVAGKAAYRYARSGKPVALNPRRVFIKEIELLGYEWPIVRLRVATGPGVYIRALARDLGEALKTGAYLTDLERTRVGKFTKEHAHQLSHNFRSGKKETVCDDSVDACRV